MTAESTEGAHRFDPEQQITVMDGAPLALTVAAYTTTPSDGFGSGDERDMMDFTGGLDGGQPAADCTPDPDRVPLALALHTPQGGTTTAAVPALAA